MRLPLGAVRIEYQLLETLKSLAQAARPYETGGLLIGWREDDQVIVCDFIALTTEIPRASIFEVKVRAANLALASYLASSSDPTQGYVGTWHSHPVPAPPSVRDVGTYRAAARASTNPLGFVIIAVDGRTSIAHVTWAGRKLGHIRLFHSRTAIPERGE